jgi:membrane protein DedA with SNARE-associated domain
MDQLASFLGQYAYWALAVGIVGENLGLPVPGEILVLLAAAMAGKLGLSFASIILVAAIAAMLGDHGSYLIGRQGGTRLLNAYCRATLCSRDCGSTAGRFFQRFGIWTVTLARFVPGLRAFATPFAGITRMPFAKFLIADLVGAFAWAALITGLGAAFGPALAEALGRVLRFGGLAFAGLVAALALMLFFRIRKVRKHGLLTVRPGPVAEVETMVDPGVAEGTLVLLAVFLWLANKQLG